MGLSQTLQDFRQYTVDGLRELSDHPAKYSLKAGRSFAEDVGVLVRDYWDAGVAVVSGLAFTQHGDNLYGDYQFPVAFFGSALSFAGGVIRDVGGIRNFREKRVPPNDFSSYRNIYVGASTIAISVDNLPKSPDISPIVVELADKIFDGITLAGAIFMDMERIRAKTGGKISTKSLEYQL